MMMMNEESIAKQVTKRYIQAMAAMVQYYNIRQSAFALRAGITPQNLSSIKSGKPGRYVTLEMCYNICNEFEISADWLLLGKGDMLPKEKSRKMISDKMSGLMSSLNPE
jgi:transcriptional regulator with XRE-family HTH domain